MLTFATPRTLIKILHPDDAALVSAYHLENTVHLAPWEPAREVEFYSLAACRARAADAYAAFEEGKACHFIALDPASGSMVGSCSFTNIVKGSFLACHLGYSIARDREGQGLMHEIAQACVGYMFDVVGLHRIMANHMPANRRSEALLKRLGFEREGYA